jgi:hypothetical protein
MFFGLSSISLAQAELWARTAGGAGDDEADYIAFDLEGNVYVSGYFKSSVLTLGDKTFKNNGSDGADMFIAKYDPSGKLVWVKTAGGSMEDEPLGISVDKSGNVLIRGYFESSVITFDGTELKNNNTDDVSMFLVKYSSSGNLLWAKSAEVLATGHDLDDLGNVYVTGEVFKGVKTSFDDKAFTSLEDGTFIAKYNQEGKVQWVRKGIGSEPISISSDATGNVWVTGIITKKQHVMESNQALINVGPDRTSDIFISKLNSDGKILWEKTIGGQGDEEPRAHYLNSLGQMYLVIRYTSINLSLGKSDHKNGGGDDIMLLKFDPSGNILWSKGAGGSGHDNPIFLVSDASENIYIVGHYYSNTITFDHLTLDNVGLNDIFIVKFAPDSKVLWAKTTGGSHHDYPNGLLVDRLNNIYLIGEFNSSPNRDKIISEFFMEKYDASGNSIWKSAEHRTEAFDFAFGELIDKTGNMYLVGYFGGNFKFANNTLKSGGSKDLFILKYNLTTENKQSNSVTDVKSQSIKNTKKK